MERRMSNAPAISAQVAPALSGGVSRVLTGAAALGAGALVAASLPPWGWWPLAFAGIAVLDRLLAGRSSAARFLLGWLFGVGWLAPGMGWMWFLTAPGYLVAVVAYAALHAVACAAVPGGRGRRLALPAALTVAEAIRFSLPFGGVPLASLAISQASGPLVEVVRVGGPLLLTWVTLVVGVGLSALTERAWRPALAAGLAVVLVAGFAAVSPSGRDDGTLSVAYVQGGGPQGTRAIRTNARQVVERHLEATQLVDGPVDLVVWPENVIAVRAFETSQERLEVAREANRLSAPLAVGITEDAGRGFTNAQVVVQPDGSITSRYDKVRRVPFGEYMPFRDFLTAIGAPTNLVPRDAVPGTSPAVLDTRAGRIGVVISWEVFFGGRAREGVANGAKLIINPTNGSSYTGTILQTQQIASSRLRALETGRWVVQSSPTGFSAFVSPSGEVLDRTAVSEQAVATRTVALRTGRTLYSRLGDAPVIALAALLAAGVAVVSRRSSRTATDPGAPVAPS
jgi:apolipoprotein N-acyltransferase